jgi:hypothetical protein
MRIRYPFDFAGAAGWADEGVRPSILFSFRFSGGCAAMQRIQKRC